MEKSKIEEYKEKLLAGWESLLQKSNEDEIAGFGRERIIVFLVAFILALALWLMVNLSRDYTLNIELPIQLGAVPADQALVKDLPVTATVSVTGEGWKLINLYNNPPAINIDVNNAEVNLFDQVQQQMNAMLNVNIQRVQPRILAVQLEDRISKRVPVHSAVNINFSGQYGFLDSLTINPDSITIDGAASLVEGIKEWATDPVEINNVTKDISRTVPLESPTELISLSQREVMVEADVVEYTEGEVQANINTRNLPPGRMVSYSPLAITIKYDVPIEEYADIQDENHFDVYVSYEQILKDSTGFVTPQIEENNEKYHLKLRSFQPRNVAYFIVLEN